MTTLYHNPRCSKSRECLALLTDKGIEFNTIKYLDDNISEETLKDIIEKLGISPIELVRTKEKIWVADYKGKSLSDDEIINAMLDHPKLIERPIVVHGNKARIGRPTERVLEIF